MVTVSPALPARTDPERPVTGSSGAETAQPVPVTRGGEGAWRNTLPRAVLDSRNLG